MNPLPLTDADLNAYVDGELAPARAQEVEQAMARDAALSSRVAELRQQNAAMREAFDPWLADTIPASLLAAAHPPSGGGRWRRFAPYFAAAATLLIGIAAGWDLRDKPLGGHGPPKQVRRPAPVTDGLYAAGVN